MNKNELYSLICENNALRIEIVKNILKHIEKVYSTYDIKLSELRLAIYAIQEDVNSDIKYFKYSKTEIQNAFKNILFLVNAAIEIELEIFNIDEFKKYLENN